MIPPVGSICGWIDRSHVEVRSTSQLLQGVHVMDGRNRTKPNEPDLHLCIPDEHSNRTNQWDSREQNKYHSNPLHEARFERIAVTQIATVLKIGMWRAFDCPPSHPYSIVMCRLNKESWCGCSLVSYWIRLACWFIGLNWIDDKSMMILSACLPACHPVTEPFFVSFIYKLITMMSQFIWM